MESKRLVTYIDKYCVLVPVYYENETAPAWRKYFVGDLETCENVFESAPEYMRATAAENAENRHYKRLEYLLLLEHNKTKQAQAIKAQYNF